MGIKDLDLSIFHGEIFGFIGPNGAGKSTTIRILLGLINISSGSAKVFGKDVKKNKEYILSNIGYMQSESNFYGDMKVGDLIQYSASLRNKNCKMEASKLMERFELDANKKIRELSLGNRKKVNIICAMQHNPKLYILDEPTSGLDPLMQKEFWNLVKERNEDGSTFFVSSHVLSEIQHHCHRAAIIRNGSIVSLSNVSELLRSMPKRVVATGLGEDFEIEGIKDIKRDENVTSFLYSGDMNILLKGLSKENIIDLSISEPGLEEVFIHYYESE
ncbi:MAG: ABC transporter ATP-binding protein [Gallicola sp.]|nr:ABC transporter ATP-binding protein [Gallicola sp.]